MAISRLCRFALLLGCVGAIAGVAGCGASPGDVSGTITLQGKPPNLKGLEIGFQGGNGRLVTASVNTDGTYKAVGVPSGDVTICLIYTPPPDPEHVREKSRLLRPGPKGPSDPKGSLGKNQAHNPIPKHLWECSTSNLSLKVAPGVNNVFDYDVQPGMVPSAR